MSCPCPNNNDNTKKTEGTPQQADQSPQSPKSPCSTKRTGFNAFKQAVSDTGNAILCKTVRRDSDACKKRAEEAKDNKQGSGGNSGGGCKVQEAKKDDEPATKSTNPMNPKSNEEDWEFVKNFIDKS